MFYKVFFCRVFDTVKNICIKTLTIKFKRKRFLLSEKNKKSKTIGYARAIDSEFDYLKEQIKCLKNEGCSLIFSEIINLDEEIKPELRKALNFLSRVFFNFGLVRYINESNLSRKLTILMNS